jgi:hypothetical protein
MMLTPEQLQENFTKLLTYIETYVTGDRKEKLLKLYNDHADRIATMPASGNINYHNCFVGGYVDHVLRVIDIAINMDHFWQSVGATKDWTEEELVFAAMNHDLGKIGTEQAEQYIPNDSEWHRKNQGKMYKNNPDNPFMTVPDRSLMLLANRGIVVSANEWFAIKLHDGLYDETNKPYLISYDPASRLKSHLPYIIHQADLIASRIEFDNQNTTKNTTKRASNISTTTSLSDNDKADLVSVFNNLFK